jgi:hypothetical protein
MRKQFKKIVCTLVLLSFVFSTSVAYASETQAPEMQESVGQISDISTATQEDSIMKPMAMFIREFQRYDSSYFNTNYTYRLMGQATIDNRNNVTTVTLYYENTTSDTVEAFISSTNNMSAEAQSLFAKVSATVGFTVGSSRTWNAGTKTGTSLPVLKGNFGKIRGYCPGVTTSGGFVYKVYNLDYPSNYWFETTTVSNAFAPATSYIHYVTEQYPYVF